MAAYLVFIRETPPHTPAEYDEYKRINREGEPRPPNKMRPLVSFGAVHALENQAPDGVVILEFPSVEEAKAWYAHPTYQEAVPHRLKSGDWRAFITEGM